MTQESLAFTYWVFPMRLLSCDVCPVGRLPAGVGAGQGEAGRGLLHVVQAEALVDEGGVGALSAQVLVQVRQEADVERDRIR